MRTIDVPAWRSRNRAWLAATVTSLTVPLLAIAPAPLVPLAEAYQGLCSRFPVLAELTNHLPPLAASLLFVLVALALVNGVSTALTVLVRTLRGNRRLDARACALPPRLAHAARLLDLQGRLTYLDHPEVIACSYGLMRPRVAISAGLLARLDDQELCAVLAHERHHVRRRDPARYLLIRALAAAGFMFPVAIPLRRRLETRVELAADRAALAVSSRSALAGALLRVVSGPATPVVGAAGLSATEARIAYLAGYPMLPPVPVKAIVASVAVLALILLSTVDLARSAREIQMICPLCPWAF